MSKKRQPINTARLPKKRGRPRKPPVPHAPASMTAKERRFVEEYCVRRNGADAARRAGYSAHCAKEIAYENLAKPHIAEAIERYLADHAAYTAKTKEDIEREMEKLAFANHGDYHHIDDRGEPQLDLSACTRDELAALTEIETHRYTDGRGEDAREVKKIRIKLADKRQALMDLAKLRGLVVDKAAVQVEDLSAAKRAELLAPVSDEGLRDLLDVLGTKLRELGVR